MRRVLDPARVLVLACPGYGVREAHLGERRRRL